jgi:hypothetical protein
MVVTSHSGDLPRAVHPTPLAHPQFIGVDITETMTVYTTIAVHICANLREGVSLTYEWSQEVLFSVLPTHCMQLLIREGVKFVLLLGFVVHLTLPLI